MHLQLCEELKLKEKRRMDSSEQKFSATLLDSHIDTLAYIILRRLKQLRQIEEAHRRALANPLNLTSHLHQKKRNERGRERGRILRFVRFALTKNLFLMARRSL